MDVTGISLDLQLVESLSSPCSMAWPALSGAMLDGHIEVLIPQQRKHLFHPTLIYNYLDLPSRLLPPDDVNPIVVAALCLRIPDSVSLTVLSVD